MFERWNFTVCCVTQSIFASSAFEKPSATSLRISSSRRVSSGWSSTGSGDEVMSVMAAERAEIDRGLERLAYGDGEVVRVRLLDDVRRSSGRECSVDVRGVTRVRQHDCLQVRILLEHGCRARNARASRSLVSWFL